jgi:hypothetical protein
MKADKQTSAQAQANVQNAQVENAKNAPKASASEKQPRTNATYNERMQVNKSLLVGNLSKLWKDCTTGTLIPRDVLTLTKDEFAEFRAYMCERHGLKAGEQPRKGWSVWYALQFCEKRVKAAAQDENAPTHAKAVAYLRKTRANLQDQAAKMF